MKPIRKREKMEAAKPQSQSGRPGRQMKNAFLRARTYKSAVSRTAGEPEHIGDSQQENSSVYVEERAQGAANILTYETVHIAEAGTEYAARQGRKLVQHRQNAKAGENRRQKSADGNSSHVSPPQTGTVREEGQPPLLNVQREEQIRRNRIPKERPLPQRVMTAKGRRFPIRGMRLRALTQKNPLSLRQAIAVLPVQWKNEGGPWRKIRR